MNFRKSEDMERQEIVLGSRGSKLAMIQTEMVMAQLIKEFPSLKFRVQIITTKGDRILDVALSKVGDKGLFTKEIENALLSNEIDIAVHSLKDLQTQLPDGLVLGAVTEREDNRDVLIVNRSKFSNQEIEAEDDFLPKGSIVGSSSLRRISQLKRSFPHLKFQDVRGNLNTRLKKLDEGQYDALVLAYAGVHRLGLDDRIHKIIPLEHCLPAVGQGALGIECRSQDEFVLQLLKKVHHQETASRCEAERSFMRSLEGGCQTPVAIDSRLTCTLGSDSLWLKGRVLSVDGLQCIESEIQGILSSSLTPSMLGSQLAENIKEAGATPILHATRTANTLEQNDG